MRTLVLGGAGSGKSAWAEALVHQLGGTRHYIATAQAWDAEMREKIAAHQVARGDGWITHECPIQVGPALGVLTGDDVVLVDCATLWLTNVMLGDHDRAAESAALRQALSDCAAPSVVVSNEVGHGIVPDHKLGRDFRNAQGQLNQQLAKMSDLVVLVVAGLPLVLKGALP